MKKLFILVLILPTTCLFAQKQYSLDDCYQLAKQKNTKILMASNHLRASVIDRKSAQQQLLPSLSNGMQYYFSSGRNINPATNSFINKNISGGTVNFVLQHKIFAGFSTLYTIKQGRYLVDAAAFEEKKVALDILQEVTLAYARLLLDQEQAVIARNNMAKTDKELQIINEKVKLGVVTKYDLYILDARRNSEQAELVTIQNDSLAALNELKQLLDISYHEHIGIQPIDTMMLSSIIATDIDPGYWVDQMLQKHPTVRQAKMEEQAARMGVKIARSGFFPTLWIKGNLLSNFTTHEGGIYGQKSNIPLQLNNNFGQIISISLQIPVFSQMKVANQVKKEMINVANARLVIKEAENSIISNTLQMINDFNAAKQRYKATAAAWRQTQFSYNMYEEKYKLGLVNSQELITAKDLLVTAASKHLQARLELFFHYKLLELIKAEL